MCLQTAADREFLALLEALADAGFPAPWDDAAPTAVIDLDVTARLALVPDRRTDGEHPAWTAGIARARKQLEDRIHGRTTEE